MLHRAPLFLVFEQSAADIRERLTAFITDDDSISLLKRNISDGVTANIQYSGVSFVARLSEDVESVKPLRHIFCNLDMRKSSSLLALEFGSNATGGETAPAVLKLLLLLGEKLGSAADAVAAYWHPTRILSGFSYFSGAVLGYQGGGAFPVLAIVDFETTVDGRISSRGLNLLSGQEILFSAPILSQSESMRRMVRMVHDIAVNGAYLSALEVDGLDADEIISLTPSQMGEIVVAQSLYRQDMSPLS